MSRLPAAASPHTASLPRAVEIAARDRPLRGDRAGDPARYPGLWIGIQGVTVEGEEIPELPAPDTNSDPATGMDYLTWLSRRIRQLLLDRRVAGDNPQAGWTEMGHRTDGQGLHLTLQNIFLNVKCMKTVRVSPRPCRYCRTDSGFIC